MKINEDRLTIPSDWIKIYDKKDYRGYDRIKYLTSTETEFGMLGIMISRKKKLVVHAFFDGIYLKYPKQINDYSKLNNTLKYVSRKWYKFYVNKLLSHMEESLLPFEYYRTMDKIMSTAHVKKRNRKRLVEHYIFSEHKDTKYVLFDCINMLVNRDRLVTDTIEPFISNTAKWIREIPYDDLWLEKYNLPAMNLTGTYKMERKMSFRKFKKLVSDWTSDEMMEVVGRYKMLTPYEYRKEPARLLYEVTQRRKGKLK